MESGVEIVGDFQQYFNIGLHSYIRKMFSSEISDDDREDMYLQLGDLFMCLPREGRWATKQNPDLAMTYTDKALREIDYKMGQSLVKDSKKAKQAMKKIKPMLIPSEIKKENDKLAKRRAFRHSGQDDKAIADLINGKGIEIKEVILLEDQQS